jgi:uncharacterized membrane protein YfcA
MNGIVCSHAARSGRAPPEATMPQLAPYEWLLLAIGAVGIGVSKSGLAGFGVVHVLVFALVFGAKASTGALLPLLIVGDICAVWLVGRDVVWDSVRRLLPPTLVGVVAGWLLLDRLDEHVCRPVIGGLILALAAGQLVRMWRPDLLARVPHARWFAWMMGILTGVTTMLANAAGPVVALYLLAVSLPKSQLISTGAWFFLIVNLAKVPFSTNLGLIAPATLAINAMLAPCVVIGLFLGRSILRRLPQRVFETLVLCLTAAAAARLILW